MTTTVGVDIGSTSVKAAAFHDHGRLVARRRIPHRLVVSQPDRLEHDARRAWWHGPRRALAGLQPVESAPGSTAADFAAVAVCSMVPSLAAVDRRGRPISAGILYGDSRGHTPDAAQGPGGDGGTARLAAWLARAEPGAAGYWPATAVASRALGGEAAVDYSVAFTSSPLFGPSGWDPEAGAAVGIRPEQLPRVVGPGVAVGYLDGDPDGAVVATGSVDGLCEQLVAGANHPGDVHVICGTTLIVWTVVPGPGDFPGLWTIPHPDAVTLVAGGASNAGGMFLDWVARLVARPGRAGRPERVDPAGVPVWAPFPRGERVPYHDPGRRAVLDGLDLTHGPAAVQRAAWEASGFVVRQMIERCGVAARRVVTTGGGTRVDGWMQSLADATNLPVHVSAVPETAAQGAAFLARLALGLETDPREAEAWACTGRVVDPDPRAVPHVEERYRRFRELSG